MLDKVDVLAALNGDSDINKIFDQVRLLDIAGHDICAWDGEQVIETGSKCYGVWKNGKPCKNCISHRAYSEKKQMTKLQYVNNAVQLVIAYPVTVLGKQYILELMKDITDSLVVNDEFHPDNTDIHNIIHELNEIAVMDPFTNLYNKKYIEKQMNEDMMKFKKSKKEYIIALFDIDNFKWVNDTYGHVNGDLAIQDLVQIIHTYTDSLNCWAARYGGDEFLLAFRNMSEKEVKQCCDKIKEAVRQKIYEVDSDRYYITASYGMYQYDPSKDDYEYMLRQVDAKMYQNKKGR